MGPLRDIARVLNNARPDARWRPIKSLFLFTDFFFLYHPSHLKPQVDSILAKFVLLIKIHVALDL